MRDINRRTLIEHTLILSLAAATSGLVAPARAATIAGDVTSLKGEVKAEVDAAQRILAQGAQVFVDDLIMTAPTARVTLTLGQGTTIKLSGSARLKLDRHMVNAGGSFDLQGGGLLFERGANGPKGDTAFKSPYGLIAVRGTTFFAGPSNGVFGVFVQHGEIDVTAAGKTVRLLPGQGTNIAKPGAAPSNAAKWKPARIRAAFLSVA